MARQTSTRRSISDHTRPDPPAPSGDPPPSALCRDIGDCPEVMLRSGSHGPGLARWPSLWTSGGNLKHPGRLVNCLLTDTQHLRRQ